MTENSGLSKIVVVCAGAKFTKQFGGSYTYADIKVGDKVSVVGFYGDATKTTILAKLVRDTSVSNAPEMNANTKEKVKEKASEIKAKVQARITNRSTKYSNLSATLEPASAMYSFTYTGSPASKFYINTSADPKMLTGVYLNFAQGPSSPISQSNPTVWDGYSCGQTLYWVVTTEYSAKYDPVLMSPISSSTVNCP